MKNRKYTYSAVNLTLFSLLLNLTGAVQTTGREVSCIEGDGVYAKRSLWGNSVVIPEQMAGKTTQNPFKEQLYQAFISGKMERWKTPLNEMEKQKRNDPAFLLELINYQYGYTAWCLENGKKSETKHYLSQMEKNLEILKIITGETAWYHAYYAAAYGFKTVLNPMGAPVFGPKSMKHVEKAIEIDNSNFQANMEMGNIWYHMPALFGGSDEKALKYYLNALEILEKNAAEFRENNWMHLNLLRLIGQIEQERGNTATAKQYFDQVLQIEPNFIWEKDELLPSLKTK